MTEEPDGRNHFYRQTAYDVRVLIWDRNRSGEPHPDAFTGPEAALAMAGIEGNHSRIHGDISRALRSYCADTARPVARVEGMLYFPVAAIRGWLDQAGGRGVIADKLAERAAPGAPDNITRLDRRGRDDE